MHAVAATKQRRLERLVRLHEIVSAGQVGQPPQTPLPPEPGHLIVVAEVARQGDKAKGAGPTIRKRDDERPAHHALAGVSE